MNILLADDHGLFRDSMSIWLMQLDEQVKIQHASCFDDVVAIIKSDNQPQLILLDLSMPGMQGPTSVAKLTRLAEQIPVAMMSADENPGTIRGCINAGAVGYLPKSSDGKIILGAIRIILAGGSYLPSSVIDSESEMPPLSNKQHQILLLLTKGLSNKEIAHQTHLTEGTVKQYVSEILKKLGVSNRTQASIKAQEMLGRC